MQRNRGKRDGPFFSRRSTEPALGVGEALSSCAGNGRLDPAGRLLAFVQSAENHFTGGSLVNRGDDYVDRLVDQAAGAIDNHHGAILQIPDALSGLLAFAQDEDTHGFTREDRRANRVGQKIYIQNIDALDAGYFIEIEVIGNNFGVQAQRQFDKFAVHFAGGRGAVLQDTDFQRGNFLDALQHFQTTTTP